MRTFETLLPVVFPFVMIGVGIVVAIVMEAKDG